MRRRTRKKDDGFTIVEVITGIAVIAVVLAGATAFFIQSMKTVDLQGQKQAAVQVANSEMETVRQMPGSDVVAYINAHRTDTATLNNVVYTVEWDCVDASSNSPCVGAPSAEATWTKVLQPELKVTFRAGGCPAAGCVFAMKTQISNSTTKSDPIF